MANQNQDRRKGKRTKGRDCPSPRWHTTPVTLDAYHSALSTTRTRSSSDGTIPDDDKQLTQTLHRQKSLCIDSHTVVLGPNPQLQTNLEMTASEPRAPPLPPRITGATRPGWLSFGLQQPPDLPPRPSQSQTSVEAKGDRPPELPPRQRKEVELVVNNVSPTSKFCTEHFLSFSDSDKVQADQHMESLTLSEFGNNYSKFLPLRVRVTKGFYGGTSEDTLSAQEVMDILFVKIEKLFTVRAKYGSVYSIPMGSAIQFSLLYNPHKREREATDGFTFKTVANLVTVSPQLPPVVCATKTYQGGNEKSSVVKNEILVVEKMFVSKGKKLLQVFSLRTNTKKVLESECSGHFSTKPSLICMYLTAILQHVKEMSQFEALLHFPGTLARTIKDEHLFKPVTLLGEMREKSLVAMRVEGQGDSTHDHSFTEIPLDSSLSDVEIIVLPSDNSSPLCNSSLPDPTNFDPTRLQPWIAEETNETSNVQKMLSKILRKGYEMEGIEIDVPQSYYKRLQDAANEAEDRQFGYATIDFSPPNDKPLMSAHSSTHGIEMDHYERVDHFDKTRSGNPLITTMVEEYITPSPRDESPSDPMDRDPPEIMETLQTELKTIKESMCEQIQQEMLSFKESIGKQLNELTGSSAQGGADGGSQGHRRGGENLFAIHAPSHIPEDEASERLKLREVVCELRDLYAWYLLGVYLGLPKAILDQIHVDYGGGPGGAERCKIETVAFWLDNAPTPTWSALAGAVYAMGNKRMAGRIVNKYGAMVPPHVGRSHDHVPQQLQGVTTPEQCSEIASLQKYILQKDEQYHELEDRQIQLEKQLQKFQEELSRATDHLQFNEIHSRMLIRDKHILSMKLAVAQDQVRSLEQQNRHKVTSAAMFAPKGDQQETDGTEDSISELPESERITEEKKGEITCLQMTQLRMEYRLKTAQNEAIDLKKQLLTMDTKITSISHDLQQLHAEKEGLHTDLQRHERDINQNLIGSSSGGDGADAAEQKTFPEYYNIMVVDGRVEVKLRKSEVEMLQKELEEKEAMVKFLSEQLEHNQKKSLEVEQVIQKQERDQMCAASTLYSYTQSHGAMERHESEHLKSRLQVESLRCKIRLTTAQVSKQQVQSHLHCLSHQLRNTESVLDIAEPQQATNHSRSSSSVDDPLSLEEEPVDNHFMPADKYSSTQHAQYLQPMPQRSMSTSGTNRSGKSSSHSHEGHRVRRWTTNRNRPPRYEKRAPPPQGESSHDMSLDQPRHRDRGRSAGHPSPRRPPRRQTTTYCGKPQSHHTQ